MCGRHPRVKAHLSMLALSFVRRGAAMCTAFHEPTRSWCQRCCSRPPVPIIPTTSKANDDVGLSCGYDPFTDCAHISCSHPYRSFGWPSSISTGPAHSIIAEPLYARAAYAAGRWLSRYISPRTISAQIMRAILLARMAAVFLKGHLSSKASNAGSAFCGYRVA
jgi:hypothetical protein